MKTKKHELDFESYVDLNSIHDDCAISKFPFV